MKVRGRKNLASGFNKMNYQAAVLESDQDVFVPEKMIAVDEMSLVNCVRGLIMTLEKNDGENFRQKGPLDKTLMNINRRNKRNFALRKTDLGIGGVGLSNHFKKLR